MKISLGKRCKRLAATVVAFAALAAVPASAQAIQLGAYTPGAPADAKALAAYAQMVGRQPDIVMWYRDFGLPLMYSNEIANLRATGQTPMVTWEPYGQKLSSIASGAYDDYLHESAKIAKSWGAPLQIRFAHEMNGDWYPWGADVTAPSEFVDAWRHIVSIFRADGATNVKWVWSPNVQEGNKYQIAPTFPGDEWIDYVGLDGYNWGDKWGEGYTALDGVFAASYGIVTQMSTKPVIITETSASENAGDKAQWIKTGFMSLLPKLFPRVEAVVWFNKVQEDDWRINSSQASLDAYRAVVNCTIFGGAGPCEGGVTTTTPPPPPKKKKPKLRDLRVTRRVPDKVAGTVSYAIDQPAKVEIRIVPRGKARKIVVSRSSRPGRNRVPLKRLLRKRHLREGTYRVVITAKDDEGLRSQPRKARFRVV